MFKRMLFVLCAMLMILSLFGCQLARPDGLPGIEGQDGDVLVGVFITEEPLNLTEGDSYNDRIYATLKISKVIDDDVVGEHEYKEYTFEGLEGMPFFYARYVYEGKKEPGIMYFIDRAVDVQTTRDAGTYGDADAEMEGTIYVTPLKYKTAGGVTMHVNPVYQSEDYLVYLKAGAGSSESITILEKSIPLKAVR